MPSVFAEPTVQELLDAFKDGVRATRDKHVDDHEGAVLEHWAGTGAILWRRAARRTTDLWRKNYIDSAEANELTDLLFGRYSFVRVPDAYGLGSVTLDRATTTAGAGTVWRGTRILVASPATPTEPRFYVVTTNTAYGSGATSVAVPIRASVPGPGTAISSAIGAKVYDPLWDTTLTVSALTCVDGTSFEPASDARARWRAQQVASRPGYEAAIIQACADAGADIVYLFPSDYPGEANDGGLNMAYVGYDDFTTDDALLRDVVLALESKRVLGDNLQVRGLTQTAVTIGAKVYLWEGPLRTNIPDATKRTNGALLGYFDRVKNFGYQRDAMLGAILKAAPEVQYVTFDDPSSDADVLQIVGGRPNFPNTLQLYALDPGDITLTFLPPL